MIFLMLSTENYDDLVKKYKDHPENYWKDIEQDLVDNRFSVEELENMIIRINKIKTNRFIKEDEYDQITNVQSKVAQLIIFYKEKEYANRPSIDGQSDEMGLEGTGTL